MAMGRRELKPSELWVTTEEITRPALHPSTTAYMCAQVTGSPVANSVTSQPRATSPSVMLLATVSHAPYCRGDVRQPTERIFSSWELSYRYRLFLLHGGQDLSEWDGGKTRGVIGQTMGNNQFAVVEQCTAGIAMHA
jgi:hypothetical protein